MILQQALEFGRAHSLRTMPNSAIVLYGDDVIASIEFLQRLAQFYASLDRSRRTIPDWIADQLSIYTGAIHTRRSIEFVPEDGAVDAAFNDDDSFRWLSDFLKYASTTPRQRAQARIIDRLRIMTIAPAIGESMEKRKMLSACNWLKQHYPELAVGEYDPANHQGGRCNFFHSIAPAGFTDRDRFDRMVERVRAYNDFVVSDSNSWMFEMVLPFLTDDQVRNRLGL
jgi:hypothetical protein